MSHNGKYNGNGDHDEDEKVVSFPSFAERDRLRRAEEKKNRPPREPMINMPPATKFLAASFLIIHVIIQILPAPTQFWMFDHFGFVPNHYTDASAFSLYALAGPLTYMFLHGSWTHLLLNTVMTTAFGAGVERLMGARRMIIFFVLCSLTAALIHFAVSPSSPNPVIGASGGLSGLFAAVLVMMQKMGMGGAGRYGIWPFVILWVGVSIMFGMMGAPGGGSVAWVAHIGGFLAGFIFLKPVMRYIK